MIMIKPAFLYHCNYRLHTSYYVFIWYYVSSNYYVSSTTSQYRPRHAGLGIEPQQLSQPAAQHSFLGIKLNVAVIFCTKFKDSKNSTHRREPDTGGAEDLSTSVDL